MNENSRIVIFFKPDGFWKFRGEVVRTGMKDFALEKSFASPL